MPESAPRIRGMTHGTDEPRAARAAHRLRARARHLATQGEEAVRANGAGTGARPGARGRVRPAAAGAEHLGDARARAEARGAEPAHALARREAHRGACPRRTGEAGGRPMSARAIPFATSPVLVLRLPVWRSRFLLGVLLLGFVLLCARALYLQGWDNEFLQAKGESRYSRVMEVPANRGRILDRHGEPLAISTPVKSVWAIPDEVKMDAGQKAKLAAL